eukprot:scaffold137_cov398-Prasinococcus_capsulatus_cf.AAC.42
MTVVERLRDEVEGDNKQLESDFYDEELLSSRLASLVETRNRGDFREMLFSLRTDLVRNFAGLCHARLHEGRLKPSKVICDYHEEIVMQLKYICNYDFPGFSKAEKLAWFSESRHAYGRSALLLSGGGALGAFHLGVVKALSEQDLLPRVLAGTSVGSIICAIVCTRTKADLHEQFFNDFNSIPTTLRFFNPGSLESYVKNWMNQGSLYNMSTLQTEIRRLVGEFTFQEAYVISGRILNITVSSVRAREPARLLNHLTSPHVLVWSAVCASCAFPGLFPAQQLLAKDYDGNIVPLQLHRSRGSRNTMTNHNQPGQWRDGSIELDLPVKELAEMFSVNHIIVSQVNPHVVHWLRFKQWLWRKKANFMYAACHFFETQVKDQCRALHKLRIFKGVLGQFWLPFISQQWEGDITIVLPARIAQIQKVAANPTSEELKLFMAQGQRSSWTKMTHVRSHMTVEVTLDECVARLQRSLGSAPTSLGRSRVPSWVCYDSLHAGTEKAARLVNVYTPEKAISNSGKAFWALDRGSSEDEEWSSAQEEQQGGVCTPEESGSE